SRARLVEAGYQVQHYNAPIGTARAALRLRPDVLILDVGMSPIGADRVVGVLRHREGLRGLPILLLGDPDQERELAAGANRLGTEGYVIRERTGQAMVSAVERVLKKRPRPAGAPPPEPLRRRSRPVEEEHDIPVFFADIPAGR